MATAPEVKKIIHKRGSTFKKGFIAWEDKAQDKRLDLTKYTIRSQIRKGPTLVEELTPTIIDPLLGLYNLSSVLDTSLWPTGNLSWDIRLTNTTTGQIVASETAIIECEKGVTLT